MKKFVLAMLICAASCLLIVPAASATPISVQYDSVYGRTVNIAGTYHTGWVYAGIYKLHVDGVATDSFCIDLEDRAISSTLDYSALSLAEAPDGTLGPMGAVKATAISKLWAMAYSPTMTQDQAAALQVAIWDCLVDLDYSVSGSGGGFYVTSSDYGAQALLDQLSSYSGPAANLIVLANSINNAQDFVVPIPVPEPATTLLLGSGLFGLVGLRRKFKST